MSKNCSEQHWVTDLAPGNRLRQEYPGIQKHSEFGTNLRFLSSRKSIALEECVSPSVFQQEMERLWIQSKRLWISLRKWISPFMQLHTNIYQKQKHGLSVLITGSAQNWRANACKPTFPCDGITKPSTYWAEHEIIKEQHQLKLQEYREICNSTDL